MVWHDASNAVIRSDKYVCGTDACDGYRCVVGNEISPACYNADQCASICGGQCVKILKDVSLTFTATPSSVTSGQSSLLSWSSTNATSCTSSGDGASWMWPSSRYISGAQYTPALTANQTYKMTCTGPGGTTSKEVTVVVATPSPTPTPAQGSLGVGACVIRDEYTSLPGYFSADSGTGYIKQNHPEASTYDALGPICTADVYNSLMTTYCVSNTNRAQWQRATYTSSGSWSQTGCAASGCDWRSSGTITVTP